MKLEDAIDRIISDLEAGNATEIKQLLASGTTGSGKRFQVHLFITTEEANFFDLPLKRACRVCGCTDFDCRQCIERTGEPCHWVEADLCSACVKQEKEVENG